MWVLNGRHRKASAVFVWEGETPPYEDISNVNL